MAASFLEHERLSDGDQASPHAGLRSKRKREHSPDDSVLIAVGEEMMASVESDLEDSLSDPEHKSPPLLEPEPPQAYDTSIHTNLPETVTLLTTKDGSKVYLVGTAHFSLESQEDVAKMIHAVQPHVVLVELCKARVNILQLDEKTILEEAKNINFEKIRSTIRQNGLFHGLMYILLLSMSAHLTKQLGMAPGGEFRRAFAEAKQVPHCSVHLGDRPIHVTLQRALASLSWWQTARLTWHLLTSKEPISKEEVEKCKRRDLLEEMLAEMTGEFPALSTVFVNERDIYLTHSLQLAAMHPTPGIPPSGTDQARRVVGVVGIGHVPGIVQRWGKVTPEDIPPIMRIPPPTLTSKVLRFGVKVSLVGMVVWGCSRVLPVPKCVPRLGDIKSSLQSVFQGTSIVLPMDSGELCCSLVDDYQHPVPGVAYTPTNIPGIGINADEFELQLVDGCRCKEGVCKDASTCSCIARFGRNYTDNGHLLDSKLDGTVVECNSECACFERGKCGNRVVQYGPTSRLQVYLADDVRKGYALRCDMEITRGRFICEYAGEVIGPEEARRRLRAGGTNYVFILREHLSDGSILKTCVDPTSIGNIGRYINHSCNPNSAIVPVRVDSPVPKLCVFAMRIIESGEEITFHYGGGEQAVQDTAADPAEGQTACLCGADTCAKFLPFDSSLV